MQFTKSLRAHFVLSALVALPFASAVHVIFGGTRPVVTTRLDPIVNPGTVGGHLHSIAGGNGFRNTYSYDALTSDSTCTTIVIPQDKSNYWTPSIYHQDANNGSFTLMPASFNIYYLVRGTDSGDKVVAPPEGLVMLAGDPNRRTYNPNNHEDQAVSFVCLDYSGSHNGDPAWAERPDFFSHNCPNGLRAQVFFPSCWDGKNLDSSDHKSHMSYPVENYNNGHCPSTHPVHIISIFYEMIVSTDQFDYHGGGSWVLSNGDVSGLGFHGDFAMGWTDPGLITSLINDCPNAAGNVADCPALAKVMDSKAASACRFNGQIVDEPIGDKTPIPALPGCNPVWIGTGPKPTCGNAAPAPSLSGTQEPLLTGWSDIGCIAEGTNGRALTGASLVDAVGMTVNKCATFCASKGFTYAGIEWSQECYCGNSLSNGASTNTVADEQCSNACAGNQFETCGGPQRLTLVQHTNVGQAPPPVSSTPAQPVKTSAPATPSKPATIVAPVVPSTSVVHSSSVAPAPSSVPPVSAPVPSTTVAPPPQTTVAPPHSSVAPTAPAPSAPSAPNAGTWVADGCIKDASPARSLSGASTSNDKMTVALCQSVCDSKGFTYAGLEFGRECYCGNQVNNRQDIDAGRQCYMTCADGNKCGGTWAISLFKKSIPAAPAPAPPASTPATPAPTNVGVPTGWTSVGCFRDADARALPSFMFSSDSMTQALCLSTCANKGFTKAGIEYARECWCDNEIQNGHGTPIADNNCYMHTSNGDIGGGSWALSVFQTTNKTKRAPKAKHFGRNLAGHVHSF